jgi:hypothetical protein
VTRNHQKLYGTVSGPPRAAVHPVILYVVAPPIFPLCNDYFVRFLVNNDGSCVPDQLLLATVIIDRNTCVLPRFTQAFGYQAYSISRYPPVQVPSPKFSAPLCPCLAELCVPWQVGRALSQPASFDSLLLR